MNKLLTAGAAALTAGTLLIASAQAAHYDDEDWHSRMMGGDCMMMGMMGQGMMDRGMMRGWRHHRGRMDATAKGRLAYLKAELDITDAQGKAWDAYAEAVNERVATMQGMHENMSSMMHEGSAVDRMKARISAMQAMLEALKAVESPTEALYAELSDEQKKKADELIGLGCGAM